jgi:hypothetical protein
MKDDPTMECSNLLAGTAAAHLPLLEPQRHRNDDEMNAAARVRPYL